MAVPPHPPHRLPEGLCVFGLAYTFGLTWAGTRHANPAPLGAEQGIRLAARCGLSWLELPALALAESGARTLRETAEQHGVRLVAAAGNVLHEEQLASALRTAAEAGSPVTRCTLSNVLCGDRRRLGNEGGWPEHLARCRAALERLVPLAERLGVALALENHQDADSEDLLGLCSAFESRFLGITLDTGNPLAVMEEPVEFAQRVAPYLRHAHLKDYRVHPAPEGFRLVRCPVGSGVVDFPALFRLFEEQEWPITRSIELGALEARLIPILEDGWWAGHRERTFRSAVPALAVVWQALRPATEEWRTPYERGEGGAALAEYEWREFRASVEYLHQLAGRSVPPLPDGPPRGPADTP